MQSSLLRQLGKIAPATPPLVFFFVGLILLLLSWLAGVYTLGPELSPRDFGYASAVNWSIGETLFAPAALYFMLAALRSVPTALGKLCSAGMVREGGDAARVAPATATTRWYDAIGRASVWLRILIAVGVLECVIEWWACSGHPLLSGVPPCENELDWSVAALHGSAIAKFGNGAFSFAVFLLLQGPTIAMVVGFAIFAAVLCNFILWSSNFEFRPNLDSRDPRCGFEAFEEVAEQMLFAAALMYPVFYLSRLWNVYLHSASAAPTLSQFIAADVARGFNGGWKNFGKQFFENDKFTFSENLVIIGAIVVLAASTATLFIVLRVAAARARKAALAAKDITEGQGGDARQRQLDAMQIWPLRYPQPTQLLMVGFMAVASIYFVRLGAIYFGMLLFLCGKKLTSYFRDPPAQKTPEKVDEDEPAGTRRG